MSNLQRAHLNTSHRPVVPIKLQAVCLSCHWHFNADEAPFVKFHLAEVSDSSSEFDMPQRDHAGNTLLQPASRKFGLS